MGYVNNPSPSTVRGISKSSYANFLDDKVLLEYFDARYVDRYGQYDGFDVTDFLEKTGRVSSKGINSTVYEHAEKPFIRQSVSIDAIQLVTGGTPEDGVYIAIPASETFQGESFITREAIVMMPGKKRAKVLARDTGSADTTWGTTAGTIQAILGVGAAIHCYRIVPMDSSDLTATASVGDKLWQFSNNNPESSSKILGVQSDIIRYQNQMMIIRLSSAHSGTSLGEISWIDFPLPGKGTDRRWSVEQAWNNYRLFKIFLEETMVYSQAPTNPNVAIERATNGLLVEIDGGGYTHPYFAGSMSIRDWDVINKYSRVNGAAPEYGVFGAIDFDFESQAVFENYFTNGSIVYGSFGGQELALQMGFSSYSKNNMTFHFKSYQGFNHPEGAGSQNDFAGDAFLLPTDNRVVLTRSGEGFTNETLRNTLEKVYLAERETNREYEHWITGGTFLPPSERDTDKDEVCFHYLSECGLWPKALNRFVQIVRQ